MKELIIKKGDKQITVADKEDVMDALDTKQNEVETQAKVTQFTNKDRINIERLINYMENGSGSNYYTLTLRAAPTSSFSEAVNNAATTANLGVTNGNVAKVGNSDSACFVIDFRKNGAIQKSSLPTIALKSIDGTKILEFAPNTFSFTASGYKYDLARNFFGSTPGIHYVYAEATISSSVYKSNILGVFVKDTNNILPHEFWTPEYYGDVPLATTIGDFRLNTTTSNGYTYSNNYSSIGEYSIMQKVDNSQYLALMDNNPNTNKNYTMQVDIYTTVDVILYFVARKSGTNTVVKTLTIPAGSNTSPSMTINSNEFVGNETQLQFRIVPSVSNGTIYSTNFRLY